MRAWTLARAAVRKMKGNPSLAGVYDVLAIPIAAGVRFPRFGAMLRPERSTPLMSAKSVVVAGNAALLRPAERSRG